MTSSQHEQHIGENIRRARRERNLTQTQLGGKRYSKSYISAVERAKILPTEYALHYLAKQLNLPETFFTRLDGPAGLSCSQVFSMEEKTSLEDSQLRATTEGQWYLLDMLLEQTPHYDGQAFRELPAFSVEALNIMHASRRASYAFLLGIIANQRGEFSRALQALEYALEHTQPKQRFAVLDVMGSNYALQCMDSLALHYHLQAHLLLKQEKFMSSSSSLRLNIAMHCAEDYKSLGYYKQARKMYEEARFYLNGQNSVKIATELYLGLGYCVYALVRHMATLATPQLEHITVEEMEQGYRSAIDLFLDSLSLSKFAGNRTAEVAAQLLICVVMLDWCAGLRQKSATMDGKAGKKVEERCASLLDQAEEHSHHILLAFQMDFKVGRILTAQERQIIYPVLTIVVRIFSLRAGIVRMKPHSKTVSRELALASSLCNHILDKLVNASDPFSSIEMALAYLTDPGFVSSPKLLTFPKKATFKITHSSFEQVEVYLAAGEVAEELGRAAEKPIYASKCYEQAELFFLSALEHASSIVTRHEQDPGYLTRCYQRCITFLEERVANTPSIRKESTNELLHVFQNELQQLPDLLNPDGKHADKE